ncbi:Probable phosphoribosylformylglycinamidine synthase, chloroplastic/mitochondrial [Seminavis robusta]|uniref:Phosphoribosylformylglycinamidine synthase n=1 Tax=Seminavis robusta TaxID=568900 RepID=A0A9N8DLQ6_9STRA|nr:Probable phosphoribosylformylglycinamidine synthase, chloroplastic/mitochondrial [Seminavis robusta]|eukprot:Sro151_g069050.1 Probable phosphoribosylformylglycinamidine synthase, chloroplastic/mitochondrial (1316) ;mRNA; f:18368-22559
MAPAIIHYYRKNEAPRSLLPLAHEELTTRGFPKDSKLVVSVETENCFNVGVSKELSDIERERLEWLLAETFEPEKLQLEKSTFTASDKKCWQVEFGPRLCFTSAFSSNATSICEACSIPVHRLEMSRRYRFYLEGDIDSKAIDVLRSLLHDRMTEEEYTKPLHSFESGNKPEPVKTVPIMEQGRKALEEINAEKGLGFDDFDLDYYTNLFKEKLGRDPTDVECFDMGQSNSEHSRHWFFGGKMVINGEEKEKTLFQLVKETMPKDKPNNSIIAFHDNSSAIRGYECEALIPASVSTAGQVQVGKQLLHPILTAETHNFPSGVAPFPGAETGTGGRLRDVMATGRGAYCVAGISSYCVGNLQIPGYELPWEDKTFTYPSNLASPLNIEIHASDGASDYGNKFGEPVIHGFTRSFGQRLPSGERFEWVKPIMFSAGVGQLDGRHTEKGSPEKGMLVVKVGGPAYRIGIGGGAASSRVQSAENADLDFDAVQRGDAEMENRMNRLMRACCDLGAQNPIVSVHDQGAGGNGNVLKEIVEPAGASYDIRKVYLGDDTLSVLEIWGAEYQENNALLIRPESEKIFEDIANRENCPFRILGEVGDNGRVTVHDSSNGTTPVDLPLELVLGKMPQKTFVDNSVEQKLVPITIPEGVDMKAAVDRVLRLLSVGSKRFLVHKVDRSVTGLCAQQQCVGPLQLPLSNVGVTAHSHFSLTGTAVACGEQPIKGLINSAAMARMTAAEAMTNLMWAKISSIDDIKCSGNWMYAAKLPGEGSKMYEACGALRDALLELGVGIDGGKDSLSMAARCGEEVVKAPGELTLTCYATCPDITKTVTPDLKCPADGSKLLFVDLGDGKACLGGSSFAQVVNQIGDASPDMGDFNMLKKAFEVTQSLIDQRALLAGHDRSDGGIAVTLMEMAFSGNCSIDVKLPNAHGHSDFEVLFSEETGFVVEVTNGDTAKVMDAYSSAGVPVVEIGTVSKGDSIKLAVGDAAPCVDEKMTYLRDVWEATSFQLEKRQRNPECVVQEEENLKNRQEPKWGLTFTPAPTDSAIMTASSKPKVAVLRQEGSNGDREMLSAFISAGFEAWDVTVSDLLKGNTSLDQFRGIAFVGGFSYADVLDSGKGWAGVIKFNEKVFEQFQAFRKREDTFSLGVCNGCQLMALLGWIPSNDGLPAEKQPRLLHNHSGKFESRFLSVQVQKSPAVMFKGMEGSSLGVWIAHGEGRFHFPDTSVRDHVLSSDLAPLRYVNDNNTITEEYPFNPNGSPEGMAALCSEDGRHLALMPHPERVFTLWQWPWTPESWKDLEASPWLQIFQNARSFCDSTM